MLSAATGYLSTLARWRSDTHSPCGRKDGTDDPRNGYEAVFPESIHCLRETCQAPPASLHSHTRDSRNWTKPLVNDRAELGGSRNSATFYTTAWHSLSGKSGSRNDAYSRQGRKRPKKSTSETICPPLATFWTGHIHLPQLRTRCKVLHSQPHWLASKRTSQPRNCLVCCRPDFLVGERQEAIEEAPMSRARGEPQGCTECRRFPLRAYTGVHHDRCRPEVAVA